MTDWVEDEPTDNGEVWADVRVLHAYVELMKSRLLMGTYDEARHGTLQEVLEEIERILE